MAARKTGIYMFTLVYAKYLVKKILNHFQWKCMLSILLIWIVSECSVLPNLPKINRARPISISMGNLIRFWRSNLYLLCCLLTETFRLFGFPICFTLALHDNGYPRNELFSLIWIYTLILNIQCNILFIIWPWSYFILIKSTYILHMRCNLPIS